MNRKIKFRAWNSEDEVMFYSREDDFTYMEADRPDKKFGVIMQGALGYIAKGYPIMQFTGLHDRNGMQIYEGDILKYDHKAGVIREVKFELGCFMACNEYTDEFLSSVNSSSVIIGDIYTTPHLINNQAERLPEDGVPDVTEVP